jgi:hypothetical protein
MLGVKRYITMDTFDSELFCKRIRLVLSEQRGVVDQKLAEEIKLRMSVVNKPES